MIISIILLFSFSIERLISSSIGYLIHFFPLMDSSCHYFQKGKMSRDTIQRGWGASRKTQLVAGMKEAPKLEHSTFIVDIDWILIKPSSAHT